MKPWNLGTALKDEIKLQLKLGWYTALAQITGSKRLYAKAKGLSDLKIHIEVERAKQLQPYRGFRTFNAFIRFRDKHICYLCGKYINYGDSNIEHDLPVIRWGYTTEENCHDSHISCNLAKGTMTAKEYLQKKL